MSWTHVNWSFPFWFWGIKRFSDCDLLTSNNLQHPQKNLLNIVHPHPKYEVHPPYICWVIMFSWPQMTFVLHRKPVNSIRCIHALHIEFISNLYFVSWRVYKVFRLSPLLISNNLAPPQNTMGFLHSSIHMVRQHTKYEVNQLSNLSYKVSKVSEFDLSWPLNLKEMDRVHLLYQVHPHIKYEVHHHYHL